jgi:phytanoyl-CoA hydroxylase
MYEATEAELAHYEAHGYFIRRDVFDADEIEQLRGAVEHVHQQVLAEADRLGDDDIVQLDNQKYQEILGSTIKWEWRDDLRAVRSMEPTFHLETRISALVDDPRVWQPCADITGCPKLSLFSDKLNVKRPGGAPFPWHQESPYWAYGAEDLERVVTLMLYLDDGTEENGCLWLIPGTHKHGHLKAHEGKGKLGALYTDVSLLDEQPTPMALPAGSVVWFHRDTVHGSQTNRSDTDRRLFLLAYQPAGLRQWRNGERRDIQTSPQTSPQTSLQTSPQTSE